MQGSADPPRPSRPRPGPALLARAVARWALRWWLILRLGALLTALLTASSTWRDRAWRRAAAVQVWQASAPVLPGFALAATLVAVVITRIVLVTANSYGLSQLALEMVVRVLVLELIPLAAALFVALRVALPAAVGVARARQNQGLRQLRDTGVDVLRDTLLPRAAGAAVAMLLLVAVNGLICLVVAYVLAHGLSPWGFDGFTRMVGRVFSPTVALLFTLKTLAFAAAVAVVPLGSALHDPLPRRGEPLRDGAELAGLVRLFAALLVIETITLGFNYV
jgi:phospholipid/cholesterol/gamma-HCH transport system permease protein